MLGTAHPGSTAASLANRLDRLRTLTDKPFGVNFIVAPLFLNGTSTRPPLDLKCIEIAARAAKVVEFFYGEPERRLVEMVHGGPRAGLLAGWVAAGGSSGRRGGGATSSLRRVVELGGHVADQPPVNDAAR